MADITYECPKCNITRAVSEFADPQKIRCRACDIPMEKAQTPAPRQESTVSEEDRTAAREKPAVPSRKTKENKLKLSRFKDAPPTGDEPAGVIESKNIIEPEEERAPLELHPKTKSKKPLVSQSLLSFLVFLLVGGAAGFLRYGEIFEPDQMEPVLQYAWGGVLLLHICITIKALSADIMQGILCIFVPGWSLIYLAISDHFYQKAIIFGLLIGIGLDGGYQLFEFAMTGFQAVQEFINTGGGTLRRR